VQSQQQVSDKSATRSGLPGGTWIDLPIMRDNLARLVAFCRRFERRVGRVSVFSPFSGFLGLGGFQGF
jgi:hypothetical protein